MKALIPITLVLALSQVSAQQKLTRYFPAGSANAKILIDNYLKPGSNAGIQFRGPEGFEPGKEYVFEAQPIYTLQAGIGLFKNTDLRLRFTPKTSIVTVEVGNWGVGVMHDLTQHFGGAEKLFALSVFLGYTKMDGTVDLRGEYSGSGQEAAVTTSGFTGQAIFSKSFKIITFYGALGYDNGKTTIDINGTYNVATYRDLNGNPMPLSSPFTLNDPFSYEYDASGLRVTAGTRLKLGPITLNGDYSFVGDKKILTVGFGFTVH